MKKLQLLNWMLFALLAFTFTACDNEPLEGDFVIDGGGDITAGEGQFVANIAGVSFLAEATNSVYNPDIGSLVISGVKQNGESIFIAVNSNAGVGTFNLTTVDNTSNSGRYFPAGSIFNPYLTVGVAGGSGQLDIITFDVDNLTISGTFAITGVRAELDADGNPVLDGNGSPVFESIIISEGSFNAIPLTIDTTTGGGGGVGVDPDPEFFAIVNGFDFFDETFTAEQVSVAGEPMIKLVATSIDGAIIRIDIPEGLGTGTFNFVDPISDGTKLIAIYTTPSGQTYTSGEFSDTGSITLTEFGGSTGKLAATFSFLASDVVPPIDTADFDITEGSFNIDYISDSGNIDNSFSADIDGTSYAPTSIEVGQAPFGTTTRIIITTIDAFSNQSLTISFPIDIEVGPHDMTTTILDGNEKVGLYNPDIGNSILFASEPGILTITSYELSSGIIEATFTFTGIDPAGNDSTQYTITNGQFIIQY
ncbi:MAG: hypothetical protein JKY22_05715 [Flavobacteriaceae bacterium]|nr:hypothetical protein [Flavobacteriaceae bacterium]